MVKKARACSSDTSANPPANKKQAPVQYSTGRNLKTTPSHFFMSYQQKADLSRDTVPLMFVYLRKRFYFLGIVKIIMKFLSFQEITMFRVKNCGIRIQDTKYLRIQADPEHYL